MAESVGSLSLRTGVGTAQSTGMPLSPASSGTRSVVVLAFPGVQPLDVTGPLEVFSMAAQLEAAGRPGAAPPYALALAAREAGPLDTASGYALHAPRSWAEIAGAEAPDTLLVAGGVGAIAARRDPELLALLRSLAPRVGRLASVCTGSLVLAAAGLLDGRRATTHWSACETLSREHPAVRVEPDPIFVRDGKVVTSAGVTAGMDLALALVEEDLGRERALEVARWLVLFLRRPGGQSQFSHQLAVQQAERVPLRDLQAWMADHPAEDLSVPALASRVGLSPRHFARTFTQEVGATPARFVEALRVECARRRLEEGGDGVDAIAEACGFGSAESMRRAFGRVLRVSPADYRRRFRGDGGSAAERAA